MPTVDAALTTGSPSNSRDGRQSQPAVQSIVIVGAGLSGLQAARALLQRGFKVTILEEKAKVGGAWLSCDPSARLQCPWQQYSFPDLPWPAHLQPASAPASTATAAEVLAYLQYYAEQHRLVQHVRFGSRLLRLQPGDQQGLGPRQDGSSWRVVFQDLHSRKHMELQATHVVLATGVHTNTYTPSYVGQSEFLGEKLHARHLPAGHSFAGKDVVVMGGSSSVWDTLAECAVAAQARSVALLYRKVLWPLPSHPALAKPCTTSRGVAALADARYYTQGSSSHGWGGGLQLRRKLAVHAASGRLAQAFNMQQSGVVPSQPLSSSLVSGVQVVLEAGQWAACAHHPHSRTLKGRVRCFTPDGLVLDSGEEVAADCVLYCTGFTQKHPFLEPRLAHVLGAQDDGLHLYRGVLHPEVRNLAFVGCTVETHNAMLTATLQAQWLVRVMSQELKLPSRQAMSADIQLQQAWRRAHMPAAQDRSTVYGVFTAAYLQQLAADMHLALTKEVGCWPSRAGLPDSRLLGHFLFQMPRLPVMDKRVTCSTLVGRGGSILPLTWLNLTELDDEALQRLHLAHCSTASGVSLTAPSGSMMAISTLRAEGSLLSSRTSAADPPTPQSVMSPSGVYAPAHLAPCASSICEDQVVPAVLEPHAGTASPADRKHVTVAGRQGSSKPTALSLALSTMRQLFSRPWPRKSAPDVHPIAQNAPRHESYTQVHTPTLDDACMPDLLQSSRSYTAGVTPPAARTHPHKSRLSRPGAAGPAGDTSARTTDTHTSARTTGSSQTAGLSLAKQATLTAGLLAHHQATDDIAAAQQPHGLQQQQQQGQGPGQGAITDGSQEKLHSSQSGHLHSAQSSGSSSKLSARHSTVTAAVQDVDDGATDPAVATSGAAMVLLPLPYGSAGSLPATPSTADTDVRHARHEQPAGVLHAAREHAVVPAGHAASGQEDRLSPVPAVFGNDSTLGQPCCTASSSLFQSLFDSVLVSAQPHVLEVLTPDEVQLLESVDMHSMQAPVQQEVEQLLACLRGTARGVSDSGAHGAAIVPKLRQLLRTLTSTCRDAPEPQGCASTTADILAWRRRSLSSACAAHQQHSGDGGAAVTAGGSVGGALCALPRAAPAMSRLRCSATQASSCSGAVDKPAGSTKGGVRWAEPAPSDSSGSQDGGLGSSQQSGKKGPGAVSFQRSKSVGHAAELARQACAEGGAAWGQEHGEDEGPISSGNVLLPARDRLQQRKSGYVAAGTAEGSGQQSPMLRTLDRFHGILNMAVGGPALGPGSTPSGTQHTTSSAAAALLLGTCPDDIFASHCGFPEHGASPSHSGMLRFKRRGSVTSVSLSGTASPVAPGRMTAPSIPVLQPAASASGEVSGPACSPPHSPAAERAGSTGSSVFSKRGHPRSTGGYKPSRISIGGSALSELQPRTDGSMSCMRRPGSGLQMDATSHGLLDVCSKAQAQPQSYVEKSYTSLLRNMAVGLEPGSL